MLSIVFQVHQVLFGRYNASMSREINPTNRSYAAPCGHQRWGERYENMQEVDGLINLIRERRDGEVLEMLNASPGLATAHWDQQGQLNGASPLHWAAHRDASEL